MRSSIVLVIIFLSLLGLFAISFSQVNSKMYSYSVRVESSDQANPKVPFRGAYFFGDSSRQPLLTIVEKETPFILNFSALYFLGIFQENPGQNSIKVSLARIENGKEVALANGHGPINVLRADRGMVGYGFLSRPRIPRTQ